jgi:hypothetical protein
MEPTDLVPCSICHRMEPRNNPLFVEMSRVKDVSLCWPCADAIAKTVATGILEANYASARIGGRTRCRRRWTCGGWRGAGAAGGALAEMVVAEAAPNMRPSATPLESQRECRRSRLWDRSR